MRRYSYRGYYLANTQYVCNACMCAPYLGLMLAPWCKPVSVCPKDGYVCNFWLQDSFISCMYAIGILILIYHNSFFYHKHIFQDTVWCKWWPQNYRQADEAFKVMATENYWACVLLTWVCWTILSLPRVSTQDTYPRGKYIAIPECLPVLANVCDECWWLKYTMCCALADQNLHCANVRDVSCDNNTQNTLFITGFK